MTEQQPIRCKKDKCEIEVQTGLFGRKYAYCWHCDKSAGLKDTEGEAIAEWNRWVQIGGFIVTARQVWPGEAR